MVKSAFVMYATGGGGEKGLWGGGGVGVLKFFEGKMGIGKKGECQFF